MNTSTVAKVLPVIDEMQNAAIPRSGNICPKPPGNTWSGHQSGSNAGRPRSGLRRSVWWERSCSTRPSPTGLAHAAGHTSPWESLWEVTPGISLSAGAVHQCLLVSLCGVYSENRAGSETASGNREKTAQPSQYSWGGLLYTRVRYNQLKRKGVPYKCSYLQPLIIRSSGTISRKFSKIGTTLTSV